MADLCFDLRSQEGRNKFIQYQQEFETNDFIFMKIRLRQMEAEIKNYQQNKTDPITKKYLLKLKRHIKSIKNLLTEGVCQE